MKVSKVAKVICSDGQEFDEFNEGLKHEKAILLAERFGGDVVPVNDLVDQGEAIISLLRWNGLANRDPFAPRKKRSPKMTSDDGVGEIDVSDADVGAEIDVSGADGVGEIEASYAESVAA